MERRLRMLGDLIRTVEPAASLRDRSGRLGRRSLAAQGIYKLLNLMTVAFGVLRFLFRDLIVEFDLFAGFQVFPSLPVGLR